MTKDIQYEKKKRQKNDMGIGRQREGQRGCIAMLIPHVSNATIDKQKGLQERQGGGLLESREKEGLSVQH